MANSCNGCGLCCRLFPINLSKEEYQSGKYQTMFEEFGLLGDFIEAKKCGANLLAQKKDGSCIYLEGNECRIHADRPKVCRDFFCTTKAKRFVGMVKIIKNNDKQKISSVLQIKG
ncbi:YkgJ family cysteine cluster protein [Candidatus Collierbacteria bacterium]|nr:YkgJ family cysteine cluster protein [Candidatus Collierbacteria bacterium]